MAALMPDWTTRKEQDASGAAPATVDADIFGWDSDEEVDAEVAALTASSVAFRGYKSTKARPSAPPPTRCTTPPRTGRRRSPRPPTDKAPPAVKPRALRPAPSRGARRVLVAWSRANAPPPPPPLKKDLLRSLAAAADDAPARSIADKLHPLAAPPTPPRAEADEAAAGPPSTVSRSDRGSVASPAARFAAREEPPRRRRPRRVDRSDPVALFAHRQADWERQRRAARRRRRAAA